MSGLNIALNTATSALQTRQTQMNVIANNLANADRVGYHRQKVNLASNVAMDRKPGQIGTGVHVENIVRVYEHTLESGLRQAIHQDGYNYTYSEITRQTEAMLAPDGNSPVAAAVRLMHNAWQEVATHPESIEKRQNLVSYSGQVADQINLEHQRLTTLGNNILDAGGNGVLADSVNSINSLAKQVAQLNKLIRDVETRPFQPQHANDLRDDRDRVVAKLAELTDLSVTEQADKTYTIVVAGTELVSGIAVSDQIDLAMVADTVTLTWQTAGTPVTISNGQVKALVDGREYVQARRAELQTYSETLATVINAQHGNGFDRQNPAVAGADIFDASVPGALTLLLTDPHKIAAGTVAGASGDGNNARAITNALTSANAALGQNTILNHPDRVLNRVAVDVATAEAAAQSSQAGIFMFQDAIAQRSGVSNDEEMMTMLEVQRAFQASAKFISVVNEMLSTALRII